MSAEPRLLGGRYELGDVLGRGGMAEVHAGKDQRLGRRVAVKLLRSDMARDPVFQARFRREAQSAAGLNHPSIVAVYDSGEDVATDAGGSQVRTPYIVMEYVEGRTVRELLDEAGGGGLGTQEAVSITAGVLTALSAAHEAGIVHRDVKPANVMVTRGGGTKVMDFGIARAVADSSATMTQTSAVIGTAQYLSPEQARGEVVDARSDLYSTGCLLYEALTGRPPFIGDSPVAVAYQHVGELPQPPSRYNRAVDDELDRVVLKALAKDRDDRYDDALQFRDDLLAAEAGMPVLAPSVAAAHAAATAHLPTTTEATRAVAAGGYVSRRARSGATGSTTAVEGPPGTGSLPVQPEPRRTSRGVVGLLVALLVVVLALGAWLLWRAVQESNLVDVPRVVGASQTDATSTLAGLGLTVSGTTPKADSSVAGTVLEQDPEPGERVEPKSSVALVVSSGPGSVAVPDVIGKTESQAAGDLRDVGLQEGTVSYQDVAGMAANVVLSTDPVKDTAVASGSKVVFVLSSGKVPLTDLTGETQAAAEKALSDLGLSPLPVLQTSDTVPAGTVISQTPGEGSVASGSSVQLVVSSGPAATPSPPPPPTPEPSESPSIEPSPTGSPSSSGSPSATPTSGTTLVPGGDSQLTPSPTG